MKLRHRLFFVVVLCTMTSLHAEPDEVVVVVNANNPITALSKKQVSALYFGQTHVFPNGDYAEILDMQRNSPQREQFFQLLAAMTLPQVNKYWARLMFSGRVQPPQALNDEQAMLEHIRRKPAAIGYLQHLPEDNTVKVVLILKSP